MTDDDLRDAVRRLIDRATCLTGGVVPVGSPEWWAAPATVQLASVALIGHEYLPETPMKQAAMGISGALDWRAEASVPSYAELQRRRAEPGPIARQIDPFDPEAAARWVATGSSDAEVSAA